MRIRKWIAGRPSLLVAGVVLLSLGLWMGSGLIVPSTPPEEAVGPVGMERSRFTVRTYWSDAQWVDREVRLPGKTMAARRVLLRAETAGRVREVRDVRGAELKAGQWVVRLEDDDRPLAVERAEALVAHRTLEFEAAERLWTQRMESETRRSQALFQLKEAQHELRHRILEMARLEIQAPFDGVLAEREVERGDYVALGDQVAVFIELNPILVVGHATEFEIGYLAAGEPGRARLSNGDWLEGRVRYVAREADASSRTFRIELEIPNPEGRIPAGKSAEVVIRTGSERAHRISPALLSLQDDGRFGVFSVGDGDVIEFHPLEIVRSEQDAIWVAGLPERVRLVTVGQGFVREGDSVNVAENGRGTRAFRP